MLGAVHTVRRLGNEVEELQGGKPDTTTHWKANSPV
jgi:hypothetical protein